MSKGKRRVVVTGMAVITAAGCTPGDLWDAVISRRSSIRSLTKFDTSTFRSRIGAEVAVEAEGYNGRGASGRLDRFSRFAVSAAGDALHDAGLDSTNGDSRQTAVYLGSALGGIAFGEEQHTRFLQLGIRSVAPTLALSIFAGAAATNVAITHGLNGPAISNANSCASGAVAIGEAFRLIRGGDADLALAGGVECPLAPLTFGSFSLIRALSTRNDDPQASCRPFDQDRDGFVMGEGAAVLVLEEMEHARRRSARPKAEILGYASTNDAHHMTAPLPDGREAARAISLALRDAGVEPSDVGYINAHATGTKLGDVAEAVALYSVFGDSMPPVSGTKPIHGHPLGASPAIESVISVMALERRFLPGTANLQRLDSSCPINAVSGDGIQASIDIALSNAFGFGGINASLILARA